MAAIHPLPKGNACVKMASNAHELVYSQLPLAADGRERIRQVPPKRVDRVEARAAARVLQPGDDVALLRVEGIDCVHVATERAAALRVAGVVNAIIRFKFSNLALALLQVALKQRACAEPQQAASAARREGSKAQNKRLPRLVTPVQ